MNKIIFPEEKLYRSCIPVNWYFEHNRVKSSLFKDSKGISVDRDGNRDEVDIIETFISRFGDKVEAIVSIEASCCYDEGLCVKYDPTEDNNYHSLIYGSENKIELSSGKAKKLSDLCKIIFKK